jgi:hypothetical protein
MSWVSKKLNYCGHVGGILIVCLRVRRITWQINRFDAKRTERIPNPAGGY